MGTLSLFFLIVTYGIIVAKISYDFGFTRGFNDAYDARKESAPNLDDMLEGLNEAEKNELLKDLEEEREFQRRLKRSMEIKRIAEDLENDTK